MTRRFWFGFLVLTCGAAGCAPDGPREFYRGALAAKSELVDSLSRVVDEASAKQVRDTAFKLHDERLKDIQDEIIKSRTALEPAFRKLRREPFQLNSIESGDRDAMVDGMKSYALYCKNVVYTNVRLARELDRIAMLVKLELLNKARGQILANQPISVNAETDTPNLTSILQVFDRKADGGNRMSFIPFGTTKENITKLNAGISDEDLKLIFDFDLTDLNVPAPNLTPPPLPSYPEWAAEVARRANIDLSPKRPRPAPKAPNAG
jgi:hypothetical protein